MDDAADFAAVREAMATVGFTALEQRVTLQAVAGILHLGNISFTEDAKGNAVMADVVGIALL
jgi:myosin-1